MKNWMKILIGTILALLLVLVFFIDSFKLTSSASFLPRILMLLVSLLAIFALVEAWYKEKHHIKEETRIDQPDEEELAEIQDNGAINIKRTLIFGVLVAGYILLLDTVGYFIITPLFLLLANYYLKAISLRNSLLIAIFFTGFVYGIFVAFLKIPVPMGLLG